MGEHCSQLHVLTVVRSRPQRQRQRPDPANEVSARLEIGLCTVSRSGPGLQVDGGLTYRRCDCCGNHSEGRNRFPSCWALHKMIDVNNQWGEGGRERGEGAIAGFVCFDRVWGCCF